MRTRLAHGPLLPSLQNKTFRIPGLLIAGAFVLLQASSAPALNTVTLIVELDYGPIVRQDKVMADLRTPAGRKTTQVYYRKVMLADDLYHVEITDGKGTLRMTGSYADEGLRQAVGEFIYYHPNGNVESTGKYARGVKTGTWYRYHFDGRPKAERIYNGKTWEEMAVELGIS
jgi:hypothetical protein